MPQLFNEHDALITSHYQIEIDGVAIAQFQEVSGVSIERQVIEHRATLPGGQEVIKKEPGPLKFGDITLKRAMTDSDDLYKWIEQVMEGRVDEARRNGSLVQYDTQYSEIRRWNFENAWPSKWEGPSGKANANEVTVETVTLTLESIKQG